MNKKTKKSGFVGWIRYNSFPKHPKWKKKVKPQPLDTDVRQMLIKLGYLEIDEEGLIGCKKGWTVVILPDGLHPNGSPKED